MEDQLQLQEEQQLILQQDEQQQKLQIHEGETDINTAVFENNNVIKYIVLHLSEIHDLLSAHLLSRQWNYLLNMDETWKFLSEYTFPDMVTQKHVSENHDNWKSFYFHFLKSGYYTHPKFYARIHFDNQIKFVGTEDLQLNINFITGDTFKYVFKQNDLVEAVITKIAQDLGIYNPEECGLKIPGLLVWLSRKKTLLAQEIGPDSYLHFRRQLFLPDDLSKATIFLDYLEAVDKVVSGVYACNRSTAINLAALQLFVSYGQYRSYMKKKLLVKQEDCLPKQFHDKKTVTEVFEQYQTVKYSSRLEAKQVYLNRIRILPGHGKAFFPVEYESKKQNLCVSFSFPFIVVEDISSLTVVAHQFREVKEWRVSLTSFSIDVSMNKVVKSFTFVTKRGSEIGEMVSRLIMIGKSIRNGKIDRSISIPVMFGFEKGQVSLFHVNVALTVKQLFAQLKEHFGVNDDGERWGLLLRDEGIWLNEGDIIGSYNLHSMTLGGVALKPKLAPLLVKLADNTVQMMEVDYSIKVKDVIDLVCGKWGVSPEGFLLKLGNTWLNETISLSKQGVSVPDVVQFRYDYIPQVHKGDQEISTYLKYIQARELVDEGEGVDHLREKDVITMTASRMIIENVSDIDYAFSKFVPKFFQEDEENFKKKIMNRLEHFVAKQITRVMAETRYLRCFGYHTAQFDVIHDGQPKTLFINQKEIILVIQEESTNVVMETINQMEKQAGLLLQAFGLNTVPSHVPIPPKEEKLPSISKWNMHLLQKYTHEENSSVVKILVNMEEVVLTSSRPKAIIKALQVYSAYVREDIRQLITEHKPSQQHPKLINQVTETSIKETVSCLLNNTPHSFDISWCTLTLTDTQELSTALSQNTSLRSVFLSGFRNSATSTPVLVLLLKALKNHQQNLTTLAIVDSVLDCTVVACLVEIINSCEKLNHMNLSFTLVDHQGVVELETSFLKRKDLMLSMQIRPDEDEMLRWFGRFYTNQ